MTDEQVWDHRNFRLLFYARISDMAGTAIAPIALAFAVLDLTGSPTDLGFVVGARSLGIVTLLLLGGVVADRWTRSIVLTWSNALNGFVQVAVAVLILTDTATVGRLIGLSLLAGGTDALSFPAAQAVVPQSVPKRLLQQANAVTSSGTNLVNLLGLVGGAGLVAVVGPGWGIAADALSCLVAALLFNRLRLPRRDRDEVTSMFTDLRQGWSAFVAQQWVWAVVAAFMVLLVSFVATTTVLGPTIADQTIGRARWGWVLGAEAVGMLSMTLLLSHRRGGVYAGHLWVGMVGVMLPAAFIIALGVAPRIDVLLVTGLLSGIGIGYFDVTWEINLQASIAEEHLSRVYSFDAMGSILMTPIGQAVAGPLAVAFGLRVTLVGAGVLVVVVCLATLALPSVRKLPAPSLDSV